ncbi:MAG: FHA domain-containing protein [Chromatiales bacterium]
MNPGSIQRTRSSAAQDGLTAMLNRFFSKPLTIEIGGQAVSFNSLAEFEFSLAGRTDVPSRKFLELMLLSSEELLEEAQRLKETERQLVDTLSNALKMPGTIGQSLREMDLSTFSQDHGWCDIVAALRDQDEEYEELQQVTVAKYMQYLSSRQEIIKHICAIKPETAKRQASDMLLDTHSFDDPLAVEEPAPDAAIREAVMLHSHVNAPAAAARQDPYTRLPKGEVVVIDVQRGKVIDLMLSRHNFKILADDDLKLVDETGTAHTLQNGRNIIGRDTICNIVVSPALRDISRLHLIIERLSQTSLRLTDLSAHGTYLPVSLVSKPN